MDAFNFFDEFLCLHIPGAFRGDKEVFGFVEQGQGGLLVALGEVREAELAFGPGDVGVFFPVDHQVDA